MTPFGSVIYIEMHPKSLFPIFDILLSQLLLYTLLCPRIRTSIFALECNITVLVFVQIVSHYLGSGWYEGCR